MLLQWGEQGGLSGVILSAFDAGTIESYTYENSVWTLSSTIDAGFGAANIQVADVYGDAREDTIVLNPETALLSIYPTGESTSFTFDLQEENLAETGDLIDGIRYQALAAGSIEEGGQIVFAVRGRTSILVIEIQESELLIRQRIPIDGLTRFLKGYDLNGDGGLDLILGIRSANGEENVLIYRNDSGDFQLADSFRTDIGLKGNNPLDAVFQDFNQDGIVDLGIQVFSGAVQFHYGNGDATFTDSGETNPFPPGILGAIEFADLDGDTQLDMIGLLQDQAGLSLLVAYGRNFPDYTHVRSFLISETVSKGEDYVLKIADVDSDGDPDIIFTRSLSNDLVVVENRSVFSPQP